MPKGLYHRLSRCWHHQYEYLRYTAVTNSEWPVLNVVNTLLLYVQSLMWIASWLYTKITRTCPDWLINLVVEGCLCMIVIGYFSSPTWQWHALCLSVAFAAVVIGTSRHRLQVGVCGFLFLLNAWDALGFPSILLPGSYKGNILICQIINSVAVSLWMCVGYVMTKQFCFLVPVLISTQRSRSYRRSVAS